MAAQRIRSDATLANLFGTEKMGFLYKFGTRKSAARKGSYVSRE